MPAAGASRRVVLTGLLAGAATLALPTPRARTQEAAAAVVSAFHEGLLDVMRNADTLGFAGRVEVLTPLVSRTFDHATMTRVACGQAWQTIDAPLRDRLIEAFRTYSVASYAANFDDYSGQSFETLGIEPARGGRVRVEARLVRAAGRGEPVAFDYTLREADLGWQAIDVVVDDRLSELARRRAEFTALLERGGPSELLAALEAQTLALAS
ncbi:MAG: ABC transporter substrate-binding protein [Pseudomonadota bacterium]